MVKNYETVLIQSADGVVVTANEQLKKGEINYLEWTMIITQTLQTRLQYLDALQQLNTTDFQLESLQ